MRSEGQQTHNRHRRHPPAGHVRAGDDVVAELYRGGDVWWERAARVVGVDGEHVEVRLEVIPFGDVRDVTVHRAFVTRVAPRAFVPGRSRSPHLRTPDVHGAAPAKGAR